jgi:hypothetical protein
MVTAAQQPRKFSKSLVQNAGARLRTSTSQYVTACFGRAKLAPDKKWRCDFQ